MKSLLIQLCLTVLILPLCSGSILAQPEQEKVVIRGKDPEYSGKALYLSTDPNPFSRLPDRSAEVRVDPSGHFSMEFFLPSGKVVYLSTGAYEVHLYVRPGFEYSVILPAYREVDYIDRVSPYYQPISLPLEVSERRSFSTGRTVAGREDVNHRMAVFDSAFHLINEQVILNRRMEVTSRIDSMVQVLENIYPDDTTEYFTDYRRYRYGILRLNEGRTGLASISKNFLGPSVQEGHPGFMELFRSMFRDFLVYYSRTPEGRGLTVQINRNHDLREVRRILTGHAAVWNDTLADMILLQELPSLFYAGSYHKKAVLILLDSMISRPAKDEFMAYAGELRERLSGLMAGHSPPPLKMTTLEGDPYRLEDSRGKYVYLMFCTPEHYGCMMEYPFLNSYHNRLSDYLEVVTVMVASSREEVTGFMSRNSYGWKALYFEEQPGILEDYLIKAFPTAFLIGSDGKMVLSPAPLPSDGLEQQLFRIMRSRGEI